MKQANDTLSFGIIFDDIKTAQKKEEEKNKPKKKDDKIALVDTGIPPPKEGEIRAGSTFDPK